MSYASRLSRDPRETYRSVDVASRTGGASPHQLITILYEDLLRELRLGALALDAGDMTVKNERLTKAVALLFALEAGLDFEKGAAVAETLSRFYRGCRDAVMRASIEGNAALVRDVVANVGEIAESWKSIGRG
ncbi:flagellar export chaperone FliS [Sphingomonas tabacisoli]|uniref:Flagellar secretion chaperone FliS n=1 Tax=Sphingomonas tabacisoli TaxID=2249466 RepID=A0ABW4I7Y9_9SPHN